MSDIVEQWMARVKSAARGRTRYDGQSPFADEAAVAEIERLRAENGHQHDEISRLDKEIDRLRRDAEPGDGQWKMAVQEERERCAKIAEEGHCTASGCDPKSYGHSHLCPIGIAAAIRGEDAG